MKAGNEIGRILKSGDLNDEQVSCIADALEQVDRSLAARFVRKELSEDDIQVAKDLTFDREKFAKVNKMWTEQTWSSTHRLVADEMPSGDIAVDDVRSLQLRLDQRETTHRAEMQVKDRQLNALREELRQADDRAARKFQEKEAELQRQHADELREIKEELDSVYAEMHQKQAAAHARETELEADLSAANAKVQEQESSIKEAFAAVQEAVSKCKEKDETIADLRELVDVVDHVFRQDLIELAGQLSSLLPDEAMSRSVVYHYLALIALDEIEDSRFLTRFNIFDKELYALLEKDSEQLARVRRFCAGDLNERLKKYSVDWNLVGRDYNEKEHSTNDSTGQTITKVITALIRYKVDDSVYRRSDVKTEDEDIPS